MKNTHINPHVNPDGTRSVSFYSEEQGWSPAGRLMPEVTNRFAKRQKSFAQRLLEGRAWHYNQIVITR
jgi:hypothetical protein